MRKEVRQCRLSELNSLRLTACQSKWHKVTLGKSDPRWVASAGCDHEVPVVEKRTNSLTKKLTAMWHRTSCFYFGCVAHSQVGQPAARYFGRYFGRLLGRFPDHSGDRDR